VDARFDIFDSTLNTFKVSNQESIVIQEDKKK